MGFTYSDFLYIVLFRKYSFSFFVKVFLSDIILFHKEMVTFDV